MYIVISFYSFILSILSNLSPVQIKQLIVWYNKQISTFIFKYFPSLLTWKKNVCKSAIFIPHWSSSSTVNCGCLNVGFLRKINPKIQQKKNNIRPQ